MSKENTTFDGLTANDATFFEDFERNEKTRDSKPSVWRRMMGIFTFASVMILLYFSYQADVNYAINSTASAISNKFLQTAPEEPAVPAPIIKVFEIQPELKADKTSNTSVVYENQQLSNGLSASFSSPKHAEYDGAFLTLNFTNSDNETQNVNVVEVYIDGHPVWRSSTPFGKPGFTTISSTTKDISKYLTLLEEKHSKFSVKVLEGSADNVNFSLAVTTTSSGKAKSAKHTPITVDSLFTPAGQADKLIPLTKSKNVAFELSKEGKFQIELPRFNGKTSSAKLELFASTSKEEVDYFKKDDAPLRLLNIFINDQYISTISPKATLYHPGSIDASDNFVPVADFGNFVGFTYEVDLVNALPLLWSGRTTLEVQVVSPVNDVDTAPVGSIDPHPKPILKDENQIPVDSWFVSGNIFLWEHKAIVSSKGKIIEAVAEESVSGVYSKSPSYSPWAPSRKSEVVSDKISSNQSSIIKFSLKDNSTLSFIINQNLTISNVLTKLERSSKKTVGNPYAPGGIAETTNLELVLTNHQKVKFEFLNATSSETLLTVESSVSFPLTSSGKKTTQEGKDDKTTLNANIDTKIKKKVNGKAVHELTVSESLLNNQYVGTISNLKYKTEKFKKSLQVIKGHVIDDTL